MPISLVFVGVMKKSALVLTFSARIVYLQRYSLACPRLAKLYLGGVYLAVWMCVNSARRARFEVSHGPSTGFPAGEEWVNTMRP